MRCTMRVTRRNRIIRLSEVLLRSPRSLAAAVICACVYHELQGWTNSVIVCVACSKQVYIGWLEATVLSIYVSEEKRISLYLRSTFLASLSPEACPATSV